MQERNLVQYEMCSIIWSDSYVFSFGRLVTGQLLFIYHIRNKKGAENENDIGSRKIPLKLTPNI